MYVAFCDYSARNSRSAAPNTAAALWRARIIAFLFIRMSPEWNLMERKKPNKLCVAPSCRRFKFLKAFVLAERLPPMQLFVILQPLHRSPPVLSLFRFRRPRAVFNLSIFKVKNLIVYLLNEMKLFENSRQKHCNHLHGMACEASPAGQRGRRLRLPADLIVGRKWNKERRREGGARRALGISMQTINQMHKAA